MPKPPKVSRINLSVIVHATENLERIVSAIRSLDGGMDIGRIERQKMAGHYGNPIQTLRLTISGRTQPEAFLIRLWTRLSSLDRSTVIGQLDNILDESGNLYLRIDKQQLMNGRIRLGQAEPIRIELVFDLRGIHRDRIPSLIKDKLNSLNE